jgi:large subunit ribosomal protein L4
VIGATMKKERPAPASRWAVRRDMEGNELGRVGLAPEVFGIEPNEAVVHQVVTAQLAAARAGTQSTKTRAEVRGGGAKPFRQKGTGRARQGSTRSPIWSGGGVALGPKPRSYRQKTPKKMVRLALCSALSDRAAQGRVAIVDGWRFDVPKTKAAVAALEVLGLGGRVLAVLGAHDASAERSFGNLPEVQTVLAGELSAYDVVRNDWIVFTDETLPGAVEAPSEEPTSDVPDGPAVPDGAVEEPTSDVPDARVAAADSGGADAGTRGTAVEEEGAEEEGAEEEGAES